MLAGVGLVFVFLELTGATHIFHKKPMTPATSPTKGGASVNESKGEPGSANNSSGSETVPPASAGGYKNPSNTSTALVAPIGNFVSNHSPGLTGSPGPHETSVCTTTPGATCTITFTNGSTTKSLEARTTDNEGNAYWDWDLQDIGLYPGTWKITATVTLNGQTQTATDSLKLQVSS